MHELNFGSVDSRQLTLRFFVPWRFQCWDGKGAFRLVPLRLLNPVAWLKTAIRRENWDFWCCWHDGSTHRCWCPTGSSFDGRIVLCGWGLVWFYSRYTGEIPCWCDKAMAEEFPEDDECEVEAEQ